MLAFGEVIAFKQKWQDVKYVELTDVDPCIKDWLTAFEKGYPVATNNFLAVHAGIPSYDFEGNKVNNKYEKVYMGKNSPTHTKHNSWIVRCTLNAEDLTCKVD